MTARQCKTTSCDENGDERLPCSTARSRCQHGYGGPPSDAAALRKLPTLTPTVAPEVA